MCETFCSFGVILFIVNMLTRMDSAVICVSCLLEKVCYEPWEPVSFKICRFGRYLTLMLLTHV